MEGKRLNRWENVNEEVVRLIYADLYTGKQKRNCSHFDWTTGIFKAGYTAFQTCRREHITAAPLEL